jgi:hypothetical protein
MQSMPKGLSPQQAIKRTEPYDWYRVTAVVGIWGSLYFATQGWSAQVKTSGELISARPDPSTGRLLFKRASRDRQAKLVAGKTVTVTWDKRDRNGRIIGWVMVEKGVWANKVMVLTGYAWWFERYVPDEDQPIPSWF